MSSEKHRLFQHQLHPQSSISTSEAAGQSTTAKNPISVTSSDIPNYQTSASDFSIEHILHRAGQSTSATNCKNIPNDHSDIINRCEEFPEQSLERKTHNFVPSWLRCTRYCPPKIPRNQKREGPVKRQLGRHPRIPFSSQQLAVLEDRFKRSPYLSSSEVTQISNMLQLADIRVKIWFQNRRARERREKSTQEQQTIDCSGGTSITNPTRLNQQTLISDSEMLDIFNGIKKENELLQTGNFFHGNKQASTHLGESVPSNYIITPFTNKECR